MMRIITPIGVITGFPPWPPCRIHQRIPCHSLPQDRARQTEKCCRSRPLPTRCLRRHHQKTIQGCRIDGAAGPSVEFHSWPRFCPPCHHLPHRHLPRCRLPRRPLGPPCSRRRSHQWRESQSNQQSTHRWQCHLLDKLNVGGGLWEEEAEECLVEMVFGCSGGNDSNARATMTTTPSAAASVSSADRNNNQQAMGASKRGERTRRRQWWQQATTADVGGEGHIRMMVMIEASHIAGWLKR